MIRNYLKTAWRNLRRNKSYATINVLGLAIGIAASLLIFLIIQFETSFDDFHSNHRAIYRVGTVFHNQDGTSYSEGVAFPVANAIRIDFPQIKQVASIYRNEGQITIDNGNGQFKKLDEFNFYYAEPEFFKIFNFQWIAGSAQSVLADPTSIALSKSTAEKYFGDWKTAVGKTLKYDNKTLYKVSGIIADPPPNTDFPLAAVTAYSALRNTYIKNNMDDWVSTFGGAYTFVVLPPQLSPATFNKQLAAFAKKHKPAEYSKDGYIAQPLSEMHFDDRFGNYRGHTFSHSLILALAMIGLFLVLVACVNFVNLATAQAVNRSREVGVRKVMGSSRRQLALQFLGETALITCFATVLAVGISLATIPFLNHLLETRIGNSFLSDPRVIGFLCLAVVVVTLCSGLYPAVILSGFNPITALKTTFTSRMVGGLSLRRVLVVLQFAIAQVLIIGMLIVVSQMNFFRKKSLGFDKAAIINVPLPSDSVSRTKVDFMRDHLLSNQDIVSASFSFKSPASEGNWNSDFKFDHAAKSTDFSANLKWADTSYFRTFNIQFVAGRPYFPSDTVREFVVNETLLRKLGIRNPADAIGKQIDFWDGNKVAKIVGVVRDFNSYSLREPMAPVVLSTWKDIYQTISIKIRPGSEKRVLAFVDKLWNQTFPEYVYSYEFFDETIANFYKQENQLSMLYKIFAGIAIFISCLGLYGLVSFMAVQRMKEVGIRKVLGASAANIVYLMSREYTLLILLAFVISAPVAYYLMHKWLQNYTYRVPLSASIFIIAIIASIVIAWLTAGQRAVKAAIANPVKSLRTE
ncbi:MAG TPA: ABC transporter permease [Chitinophagaceae bacterium]